MANEKPVERLKQEAKQQAGLVEKTASRAATTVTKPVRHYRAYLFQIYIIVAVVAFGALFFAARNVPYFRIDLTTARFVQSFHSLPLDVLMRYVTGLGFDPLSILLCALIVLYLLFVGLYWEASMAVFAAGGVTVLGALVKIIVQRQRPTPDLVNVFSPLNDFSFPSGHVLFFTAFLGFLCFLFFTLTPHSWQRGLGIATTIGLIVLVGLSRVYLGQHWPSDVAGAYLLGSLWLALTVYVYRWGKPRFFARQPAAPEKKSHAPSA